MNLTELISQEKYGNIRRAQYPDKILVSGTAPAGQETRLNTTISTLGDFYSLYLTGRYTTLALDGVDVVDNGVCPFRIMIIDGNGSRKMSNDFIPADLIFSPGRIKSSLAANCFEDSGTVLRADNSNQLFFPFEFQNLFTSKSSIIVDVKNDSTYANNIDIVFHGVRIIS